MKGNLPVETKKSTPIGVLLGGVAGGVAAAFIMQRRDRQAGKPSLVDKVKQFERKLYADGENRAHTFNTIKQEAEVALATDAFDEKSAIQ